MTSSAPTAGYLASPWRTYLRRGTVPVVIGVVVGVLAAVALLKVVPKEYTADARVLVTDTGLDQVANAANGRTNQPINLDTEAQLVTSAGVIRLARHADPELTRRYTYNKLISRISVTVPPNTTVLQIAFTDHTATDAYNGANALANAYLANRQQTAQNQLNKEISSSQANAAALNRQLQSLYTKLSSLPASSSQRSVISSQILFIKEKIRQVNANTVGLEAIQITPGQIVSPASMPQHPSSPSKTLFLASGFAVGLLLGLLAAWLRVRFRRRIHDVDDLAHIVDVPCIAVFNRADPSVVGALAAYRHLTVVVSAVVHPPARVVVTSPLVAAEGSHVAAGLAAALTRRGTTAAVLQVHGDEVSAPQLPGIPVTQVLDADDVLTNNDASLPTALDRIRGDRAMLVIDVPGATITADAQVMGAEADAVLLVVTARTATKRVRQAVAGLDSVGAPLLGTVLVREAEPVHPNRTDEPGHSSRASTEQPPIKWPDETDGPGERTDLKGAVANGKAPQRTEAARRSMITGRNRGR